MGAKYHEKKNTGMQNQNATIKSWENQIGLDSQATSKVNARCTSQQR